MHFIHTFAYTVDLGLGNMALAVALHVNGLDLCLHLDTTGLDIGLGLDTDGLDSKSDNLTQNWPKLLRLCCSL